MDERKPRVCDVKPGWMIDEVIRLADRNTATLGFVPRDALRKAAERRELVAAIGVGAELLGYVWYSVTRNPNQARIHHLCVAESSRGSGIARLLVNAVVERTRHVPWIVLRCRRDLPAHEFWPRVGFVPLNERRGRGKDDTCLTCFWYDHGHPSLETHKYALVQTRQHAILDTNVFLDLSDSTRPRHRDALSLLADWLWNSVVFCVTPELYYEITGHDSSAVRQRDRSYASRFKLVTPSGDELERAREVVARVLPAPASRADRSDREHLAAAIACGADFFVTYDKVLLRKAPELLIQGSISVVRPLELILNIDELRRASEYVPARLAASGITIGPVTADDAPGASAVFGATRHREKRAAFDRVLRQQLMDIDATYARMARVDGDPRALILVNTASDATWAVRLFRVAHDRLAPTLARHLAAEVVLQAARRGVVTLRLDDYHASDEVRAACRELGFVPSGDVMVKVQLGGLYELHDVLRQLEVRTSALSGCENVLRKVQSLIDTTQRGGDSADVGVQIERLLWPLRVADANIPSFLIPIKPCWAELLLDPKLAAQGLFDADASVILQYERAYYRAARPRVVTAPARVLWYVSHGEGYTGTGCVRACSTIDDVVVRPASDAYRLLSRLGVYEWKHVLHVAKKNPDALVMGVRFSGTQLACRPVVYKEVLRVLTECRGCTPQLTTALRLSGDEFASLYRTGFDSE